jgi:thiol-disulfide isomerase/thioredoxin
MRFSVLLFGFLFSSLFSFAQPLAPDFTVTDSHGNVHHLYADYLNQGKTVMIEVFFTTCPPCNSIAPYLEPLYQEWVQEIMMLSFLKCPINRLIPIH